MACGTKLSGGAKLPRKMSLKKFALPSFTEFYRVFNRPILEVFEIVLQSLWEWDAIPWVH